MDTTFLPQFPSAWLSRPAEIRAHLRAAAFQHGMVELELGTLRLCALIHPEGVHPQGFRVVPLSPPPPDQLPAPGRPFQVHYGDALTRCSFLTHLRRAAPDAPWDLDLPKAIERRERRVAPRVPVAGLGVRLELWGPLGLPDGRDLPVDREPAAVAVVEAAEVTEVAVVDLSALGLAFRSPDRFRVGALLRSSLTLEPGDLPLHPVLEVRGVRAAREDPAAQVVGCAFSGLGPSEYDRIDATLALLRNLS